MGDVTSPLVQRRRLRTELKRARLDKGLTQEQVAQDMEWSLSKMIRIETATTGISTNDLKALLPLYGITDTEQTEHLITLARAARERSWWNAYKDVAPTTLLQLIEYESAASAVRQFETMFVPGILQTEEYARAVIEDFYDDTPASERVAALVELRTRREELLERASAPRFYFMLDEAVIRRTVGSAPTMRRQLRRLIEAASKPNITIEIITFAAGLHPGMKGPFEVVEFADPADGDVVFLESPRGDMVSDEPVDTLHYREAFDHLRKASLGPRESGSYLAEVAKGMC